MNINSVISSFFTEVSEDQISVFEGGNINSTYKIERGNKKYILQKINKNVFTQPERVMSNLEKACDTLEQLNYPLEILKPVRSLKGNSFEIIDGEYWRVFPFFESAFAPLKAENPSVAYKASSAYGLFDKYLESLPIEGIYETIPDFFNFEKRLEYFKESIKKGIPERVSETKEEIDTIMNDTDIIDESVAFQKSIPKRPIHGDAKASNVMLRKDNHEPYSVIDLDTLMPGHLLYDFGDMVRSCTSPTEEDSDDLKNTQMSWNLMEAVCTGFIQNLGSSISSSESESLVPGSIIVTYVQAIRFLADYLRGDIYYQIEYPTHNLIRTRNQIALYKSILSGKSKIASLIQKLAKNNHS